MASPYRHDARIRSLNERPQPLDALMERRMRAEHAVEFMAFAFHGALERIHNVEVSRGAVGHLKGLLARAELLERAHEPLWIAREFHRPRIRQVLALPAHGK